MEFIDGYYSGMSTVFISWFMSRRWKWEMQIFIQMVLVVQLYDPLLARPMLTDVYSQNMATIYSVGFLLSMPPLYAPNLEC
jgi:hypothetical protein